MNSLRDLFDIHQEIALTPSSSWRQISDYFMWLTLQAGGCTKSTSGALSVTFPSHFYREMMIMCELGGYDSFTLGRHARFEATSEEELKSVVLSALEAERKACLRAIFVQAETM